MHTHPECAKGACYAACRLKKCLTPIPAEQQEV